MANNEAEITANDVADLNRTSLAATSTIGRYAATALLVLAGFGTIAWAWIVASEQGLFNSGGRFGILSQNQLSLAQRIDLFASSVSLLMTAALVGGLGLGLRLVSELLLSRTGGSLTGVEVGDIADLDDVVEDRSSEDAGADQDWAP